MKMEPTIHQKLKTPLKRMQQVLKKMTQTNDIWKA